MSGAEFVPLSLPPLLIGTFAALACALPGNFLVLRRQALIGDAISHVVLPGIVLGFLVTGAVSTWPMLLGAAGAAILAVVLIETIRRLGRIEPDLYKVDFWKHNGGWIWHNNSSFSLSWVTRYNG